jgi:S4 domain protein YaaA
MNTYQLFDDYILLGKFLKEAQLIETGGQAKFFLAENAVLLNDEPENRRGKKLYPGDRLAFPEYDLAFIFEKADDAAIAERQAELEEEARVKAIVARMNKENKATKAKSKGGKSSGNASGPAMKRNGKPAFPGSGQKNQKQKPSFPGRRGK